MDITKEELVELIKSTVTAMNAETKTCDDEKVAVNQGDSVSLNQGNEPNTPNKPNKPVEDEKPQNDEPSTEETPGGDDPPGGDNPPTPGPGGDEPDPGPGVEDPTPGTDTTSTTEVIQEEVLNSAPTTSVPPVSENEGWRNLKGKAFREWCDKHADFCRNYRGE